MTSGLASLTLCASLPTMFPLLLRRPTLASRRSVSVSRTERVEEST